MRSSIAAAALLLSVVACAGTPGVPAPEARATPYVILVSFDAFRYDYFDRYRPGAIAELANRGVRAEAMIPSFPSKTFPNHYTLATGLYPGHHGITGNAFWDPARKAFYRSGDTATVRDGSWYGGEPIWVSAQRNGVKSGSYFWTGSEATIAGARPTYSVNYNGKIPNADRVDAVTAWLRKPAANRPHLVLIYFSEVDDTTHKFGPEGAQTAHAVADVDNALRRLVDSVHALPFGDSVNVVLVSDHGMITTPPTQVIAVQDIMSRAGVDSAGIVFSDNGPTLSLWFGGDALHVARTKIALDRAMGHARAYLPSETPASWHVSDNPRFGDLLLVAEPGYILQRRSTDKAPSLGNHGYTPDTREMRAIFVAAGPGVRQAGLIPAFENVNVYPFLCDLLKISCPRVDGSSAVLRTILR